MTDYLLDTNHMSEAIRKVSTLRYRIRQARGSGSRFGTCWPVLCELEAGILQTADPEGCRRTLHGLLKEVRIWPLDWDVVHIYGQLFNRMKEKGRALSHVDLVLAAMATHMVVTVLTADKDFEATPEINTENWV